MISQSLNGTWTLQQRDSRKKQPASVPGCVHTDLMKNDSIPDPFYRDTEKAIQWISERDWTYTRTFEIAPYIIDQKTILLHCRGLDTLATVSINGVLAGTTDNMFRTWEFDIKPLLKTGRNTVSITFASTYPYLRKKQKAHPMRIHGMSDQSDTVNQAWIRKEPCNYGWDWNLTAVTCGIWQDISIIAYSEGRLADVHHTQRHHRIGTVSIGTHVTVDTPPRRSCTVTVTVRYKGRMVASDSTQYGKSRAVLTCAIKNPQLWWPNGMGAQPLYTVETAVTSSDGTEIDRDTKRIGLRTLELERKPDRWGETFRFKVNGAPFFARGANWVPCDAFASRPDRTQYERLIKEAAFANFNMLRAWGGGHYEPDVFYDLCDEYGICVWQDFHFSCAAYPAFDDAFMENVKHEATDTIRRLRHHACLALWCGNNELELLSQVKTGSDHGVMTLRQYNKLFNRLLPDQVQHYDPGRSYWPSSPHTPSFPQEKQNADRGDTHLWQVWFSTANSIRWYETQHTRFCSEFGFQSFPHPRTIEAFTLPEDRTPGSDVMLVHQKGFIGNSKIIRHIMNWFQLPRDFESTVILSQLIQGMCMKSAVEHWRRTAPRCMGALYWKFNDSWPVASGSSVDYYGRRKALHYLARRFFAPVTVSAVHDDNNRYAMPHIINDTRKTVTGTMVWYITHTDGTPVASGKEELTVRPGAVKKARRIPVGKHLTPPNEHRTVLWLEFRQGSRVLSENMYYYTIPAMFRIRQPRYKVAVGKKTPTRFVLTVRTDVPAFWVHPELEGLDTRLSDSFFHLRAGTVRTLTLETDEPATVAQVRKALKIKSLTDTYTYADRSGF